jgi:hypothetical protein
MFAELFFTAPDKRKFHVYVEGSLAISNLDVFVAAGSIPRTALVIPITKTISDGFASVEFVKVLNNPIINGFEIVPATASGPGPIAPAPSTKAPAPFPTKAPTLPPVPVPTKAPTKAPVPTPIETPTKAPVLAPVPVPTKAPVVAPVLAPTLTPVTAPVPSVRINAGGEAYTDPNSQLWIANAYVVGNVGSNFHSCASNILNTTLKTLYCTNRWYDGNMIYEVPVPSNGNWEIRLHFAEVFFHHHK